MGNRLTQIATRTGDGGTTGLGDNTRVSKNSLRVHAMGEVLRASDETDDMYATLDGVMVKIEHAAQKQKEKSHRKG